MYLKHSSDYIDSKYIWVHWIRGGGGGGEFKFSIYIYIKNKKKCLQAVEKHSSTGFSIRRLVHTLKIFLWVGGELGISTALIFKQQNMLINF